LEIRRMQMIAEVGAENSSTTVLMIPSDFVSLAHNLSDYLLNQERQRHDRQKAETGSQS
jgi:hypothetical protein